MRRAWQHLKAKLFNAAPPHTCPGTGKRCLCIAIIGQERKKTKSEHKAFERPIGPTPKTSLPQVSLVCTGQRGGVKAFLFLSEMPLAQPLQSFVFTDCFSPETLLSGTILGCAGTCQGFIACVFQTSFHGVTPPVGIEFNNPFFDGQV